MKHLIEAFVQVSIRFWIWGVLFSVLLIALGFWSARKLGLNTDLEALLPKTSPRVVAMEELKRKAGSSYDLRLVFEGGNFEKRLLAAEAFAGALRDRVDLVRSVRLRTPKDFLEQKKFLLLPLQSLNSIQARIERERRANAEITDPLGLEYSEEEKSAEVLPPPESDQEDLNRAKEMLLNLDSMRSYYQTEDQSFLALLVFPQLSSFDIQRNRMVLREFEALIQAFDFTAFDPEIRVSIFGKIYDHVDRYDSILADVSFGGWGLALILLIVVIYFQSLWSLGALIPPLLVGLGVGTGLVSLLEGKLNTISIFLVLVVFGVGIEFGIHLWARYLEERREKDWQESLHATWQTTGRATLTSSTALLAGFALLTVSSFQGFAQFGRVAIILVASTALGFFVVMPVWIVATEHLRRFREWPLRFRDTLSLGRFLRSTLALRVISLAVIVSSVFWIGRAIQFDYTFDDAVQKKRPIAQESLAQMFTERIKPSAIAAFRNPEEAQKLLDFYDQNQSKYPDIAMMSGLRLFLPADQELRLQKLREISDDLEPAWISKFEDEVIRDALRELKDRAYKLSPFAIEDLPAELKDPYLPTDGSGDSLIYIFDLGGKPDGRKAMKFSAAVDQILSDAGVSPIISGQELIFADIVKRVVDEGPKLVLGMLLLIFLICWLDFRSFYWTLIAMAPVLFGFLLTGLVLVAIGTKVNFYNMVAWASLGSMVVDNSIHFYHRFLEKLSLGREEAALDALRFVGPTIVVCTLTSICGYAGMVFANHQGIASLGLVATVGLACCMLSAVAFFPAWLVRIHR